MMCLMLLWALWWVTKSIQHCPACHPAVLVTWLCVYCSQLSSTAFVDSSVWCWNCRCLLNDFRIGLTAIICVVYIKQVWLTCVLSWITTHAHIHKCFYSFFQPHLVASCPLDSVPLLIPFWIRFFAGWMLFLSPSQQWVPISKHWMWMEWSVCRNQHIIIYTLLSELQLCWQCCNDALQIICSNLEFIGWSSYCWSSYWYKLHSIVNVEVESTSHLPQVRTTLKMLRYYWLLMMLKNTNCTP